MSYSVSSPSFFRGDNITRLRSTLLSRRSPLLAREAIHWEHQGLAHSAETNLGDGCFDHHRVYPGQRGVSSLIGNCREKGEQSGVPTLDICLDTEGSVCSLLGHQSARRHTKGSGVTAHRLSFPPFLTRQTWALHYQLRFLQF